MPLSDDQKAMLRLLAQREQGYEDLAALMGLSVDEVRAKVKDALAQLEAEGEPAPALPAEPAAEVETPPQPEAPAPVETPAAAEPAAAAPETPAPPAPVEPEPKPRSAAPVGAAEPAPKRTPPPRPQLSLPGGGARAALVAGLLVVVALVVVLVVSGDDGSSGNGGGTSSGSEQTAANPTVGGKEVTQAVLDPVDGSDARGLAVFGRVKNALALQIQASGLEATGKGEAYTIWMADSPQKMLPLATTAVGKDGKIAAQVQVPTEVLGYLASETFDQIVITRTVNATLKAALDKATSEKAAPAYTGTRILEGTITGPIIGEASP